MITQTEILIGSIGFFATYMILRFLVFKKKNKPESYSETLSKVLSNKTYQVKDQWER